MTMSIITTSGRSFLYFSTTSTPSDASPTTSQPSGSMMSRIIWRMNDASSAIRTLFMTLLPASAWLPAIERSIGGCSALEQAPRIQHVEQAPVPPGAGPRSGSARAPPAAARPRGRGCDRPAARSGRDRPDRVPAPAGACGRAASRDAFEQHAAHPPRAARRRDDSRRRRSRAAASAPRRAVPPRPPPRPRRSAARTSPPATSKASRRPRRRRGAHDGAPPLPVRKRRVSSRSSLRQLRHARRPRPPSPPSTPSAGARSR